MLLNCHTVYSFCYGTYTLDALMDAVLAAGFKTFVLADINNTSACLDAVRLAPEKGLKPILGIDFRQGADQKFVGALIVPSIPNLREWMKHKGIPFTTNQDAIHHPQVLQLYKELIESFNTFFNHVEQIKKFELIPDEWGIDTGELTPKLSMKRKVIMEKFNGSIQRIYP